MIDNLAGLRPMIDRHGIPPRMLKFLRAMEEHGPFRLETPPPEGMAEVREVMALVEGPALIAVLLAMLLGGIEIPAPEAEAEEPEGFELDTGLDDDADAEDTDADDAPPPPAATRERYVPDENDSIVADCPGYFLVNKRGGYYAIVERADGADLIVDTVRGKEAAHDAYNALAG